MNTVVSSWPNQFNKANAIKNQENENSGKNDDLVQVASLEEAFNSNEKLYLPYTGNGYIGISANSKLGLFANQLKSLSLPLLYSPLSFIYTDNYSEKKGILQNNEFMLMLHFKLAQKL